MLCTVSNCPNARSINCKLTATWIRASLHKLTVAQLIKIFPAWRFVTLHTRAHQNQTIQSMFLQLIL